MRAPFKKKFILFKYKLVERFKYLKNIVIIPTLNENDNINYLFKLIVNKFKIPILFIDDNSTDGTREKILNLSKKSKLIIYKYEYKNFNS